MHQSELFNEDIVATSPQSKRKRSYLPEMIYHIEPLIIHNSEINLDFFLNSRELPCAIAEVLYIFWYMGGICNYNLPGDTFYRHSPLIDLLIYS